MSEDNSSEANVRAEERHAWDLYAAAAMSYPGVVYPATAGKLADEMLSERRKRFDRKEEP